MAKSKLSQLTPDKKNANKGTERGRYMVEKSLQELGAGRSILVDKNGNIIAGNKTAEAAASIGLDNTVIVETDGTQLVVVKRTDLDLDDPTGKARQLAYADNRTSEVSYELDPFVMASDLEARLDLSDFYFDYELQGIFEQAGSELIAENEEPQEPQDSEPQIDKAKELAEKWGVQPGQLWILPSRDGKGEHRLLCGDSTKEGDIRTVIKGDNVTVFSDPPYGIKIVKSRQVGGGGVTKFGKVGGENRVEARMYSPIQGDENTDAALGFYHACKSAGIEDFIIWGGNYFTDFLPPSPCWLVWDKKNTGNFADVELAWTSYEKASKKYEWLWNGMSREGERKNELKTRVHPTQKPVGLHQQIMSDFPANIYLDGFLGSGTTLIACENTGRHCRAIEISPGYVAVALQRYLDTFGIEATCQTNQNQTNQS